MIHVLIFFFVLKEKVITKHRRYPKHHTMVRIYICIFCEHKNVCHLQIQLKLCMLCLLFQKLIPGDGRKMYVPRGGVKISFAKVLLILFKCIVSVMVDSSGLIIRHTSI